MRNHMESRAGFPELCSSLGCNLFEWAHVCVKIFQSNNNDFYRTLKNKKNIHAIRTKKMVYAALLGVLKKKNKKRDKGSHFTTGRLVSARTYSWSADINHHTAFKSPRELHCSQA